MRSRGIGICLCCIELKRPADTNRGQAATTEKEDAKSDGGGLVIRQQMT